ncbi:hypothetical protein KP13_01138 [Klebsiella pneumoniae subsp. pneumoniae Kp13]|nr:hypothetical protein KP13_01138 [Klebsiella pneumoniae subsp. pneumoniae Kp13]
MIHRCSEDVTLKARPAGLYPFPPENINGLPTTKKSICYSVNRRSESAISFNFGEEEE